MSRGRARHPKVRLNLVVPISIKGRVEDLIDWTEAASMTEVIREAIIEKHERERIRRSDRCSDS